MNRAYFKFHRVGGPPVLAHTNDRETLGLVLGACEQLDAATGWTVDLGACSSIDGRPLEGCFVRVNLQQVVALEWWTAPGSDAVVDSGRPRWHSMTEVGRDAQAQPVRTPDRPAQ